MIRKIPALVLVGLILSSGTPNASAIPGDPEACPSSSGDYGSMGAIEGHNGPFEFSANGVSGMVHINDEDVSCQRVSSIYVAKGNSCRQIEFGYVIGWSNIEHKSYANPTLFYFYTLPNCLGVGYVDESIHPPRGEFRHFKIADGDHDGVYQLYFKGDLKYELNLGWAYGYIKVATEGGHSVDPGLSDFDNLMERNDTNLWTSWDDPCGSDDDPAFKFSAPQSDHVKFVYGGQQGECS